MDKGILAWLGSTSGAVIFGGVIVSVLQSQTRNKLSGDDRIKIVTVLPEELIMFEGSWMFGLMLYIIPGIIGLVAAFTQNEFMYVMTCAMASGPLVVMSIFIMLNGVLLIDVASASKFTRNHCVDAAGSCICRYLKEDSLDVYRATPFKTCADLENSINDKYDKVNMTLLFAFLFLTWVAEFEEFLFANYYACRIMPTPRAVIIPAWLRNIRPLPYMMPRAYGQPGSDVIYQATIKNQLTVIVRAKPVTDNRIDG